MVDLSIIIVSYNTPKITLECVKSVVENVKRHSYEIIIVDNASKDIGELRHGLEGFQQVSLIMNNNNLGFSKGNNLGIRNSEGKYILLLNSDTVVIDDSLDRLVEKCKQSNEHVVASPSLKNESGGIQLGYGPFPSITLEIIYLLKLHRLFKKWVNLSMPEDFCANQERQFNNGYLVATCMLFPRSLLTQLPGEKLFDDMFLYGEEFIWFRDFKNARATFIYDPAMSVTHYVGMSSEQGKDFYFNRKYNQMLGERTYLRKFHSKPYRYVFFIIRLLRLRLIGVIDPEMKMRYEVCMELLKSGV